MRAYSRPEINLAAFIGGKLLFRNRDRPWWRSERYRSRRGKVFLPFLSKSNEEISCALQHRTPMCFPRWRGRYGGPFRGQRRDVDADESFNQFVPEGQELPKSPAYVELTVRVNSRNKVGDVGGKIVIWGSLQYRVLDGDDGIRRRLLHEGSCSNGLLWWET